MADSKISDLGAASALVGTELVPIVQGGNTKKITTQDIADLGGGGGGAVDSVNGAIGVVVLDSDDIAEGVTNEYYTEAKVTANTSVAANTAKVGITPSQITILSNTSGTNTGDQDLSGYLLNTTDTLTGNLTVTGAYVDSAGDPGVAGQVLSSTVTGTDWINAGGAALSGTSIQRVAATSTPVGVSFWDTDLKIPCYLESTIWYNAAGGII
jgi:hypothetical protein